MPPFQEELLKTRAEFLTRRWFLRQGSLGLGALSLATLGASRAFGSDATDLLARAKADPLGPKSANFPAKAKRVIYLHMAGSPSQHELFDYKPELAKLDGKDCPGSFLEGKRFAFIQGVPKMLGPQYPFRQYGKSGAWVSDRLPLLSTQVDDLCFLKSLYTDQFNHAPAQLLIHTGSPRMGRPAMGAWALYGLGTENTDLPGFVVLVSGGKNPDAGKSVWGSGFIPSVFQGVQCRGSGEPILFAGNPDGVSRDLRRATLDAIGDLNQRSYRELGDPETVTRISQYELAFRMQMSVPEATDLSREPAAIHELYGTQPGKNSFANNCLLARRLVERGVRFVQLYDWGWDSHGAGKDEALNGGFKDKCAAMDRSVTALLQDLKQRGLLEDTLVVWGGEFGRTPMRENRNGKEMQFVGRDHNPGAMTMWMAGAGVKAGTTYGASDEFGYQAAQDKAHVHDLQATILHLLGFDHTRLTYHLQGRDYRLTDVHGHLIKGVVA